MEPIASLVIETIISIFSRSKFPMLDRLTKGIRATQSLGQPVMEFKTSVSENDFVVSFHVVKFLSPFSIDRSWVEYLSFGMRLLALNYQAL